MFETSGTQPSLVHPPLQFDDPGDLEWKPELLAELLDPESWGKILDIYAHTMKLAVALLDVDGRIVGACHNPQPVWSLAREAKPLWPGACPFCLETGTNCTAAADALRTGTRTLARDPAGFAHVAIALRLGDRHAGWLLAGQVLSQYPESLVLQRSARVFGLPAPRLWHLARRQEPVSCARLTVYGELLEALGQTVLQGRYSAILERQSSETCRYLASAVASSTDAILSKNLLGIVTTWNAAAQHLFGYSAADIIGRSVLKLIPAELANEELAILAQIRRGERIQSRETVRVGSAGQRISVSLTVSPILNEAGKVIGASSIARDISDRKALETAFRDSEETRRQAVDAGEVGLWAYDTLSGTSYGSARSKAIFGLAADAPVPSYQECLQRIHRDDVVEVERGFNSCICDGTVLDLDFRVVDHTGVVRWAQAKGSSSTDREGSAAKIQGTLVDFTSRKQTEESLRQTNSQLEAFTYITAHDLQEPLRNIALSIQLALGRPQPQQEIDGETAVLLTSAAQNARRMAGMLKDLLAYSRALHDNDAPVTVTNCGELLASALQSLSIEIQEASAQITQDDLPAVKMSRTHVLQLFLNLIGNALKYRGPDPPRIQIGISSFHQGHCQLYVKDNGVGIEPQFQDRVFGLFKRLNKKKEASGTGIGLALCKSIVEHYGGKIWIESDGSNGTTFFFTVPAVEVETP